MVCSAVFSVALEFLVMSIIGIVLSSISLNALTEGSTFSTNTTIVQTEEPASPFIARINSTVLENLQSLGFSEVADNRTISIDFYIRDCAEIRLQNRTISKNGTLASNTRNLLYEQYVPFESVLVIKLQLQLPYDNFSRSVCSASLLVFDSYEEYNMFLIKGILPSKAFAEYCISKSNFSVNVILPGASYYYFGLNVSSLLIFDTAIKYQIFGIVQQYLVNASDFGCSISNITSSRCDVVLSAASYSDVCVVGHVPSRSESEIAIQATITVIGVPKFNNNKSTYVIYLASFTVVLIFSASVLVAVIFCFVRKLRQKVINESEKDKIKGILSFH